MDDIKCAILKELYGEILDDLDPIYILPCLYEILPSKVCNKFKQMKERTDRVHLFMEMALNCMTLEDIFQAFSYQGAFVFLTKKILNKLKVKIQNDKVYYTIRIGLFTRHRKELVEFRHRLKMFSLTGDQKSFDKEVNQVVSLWNNDNYRRSLPVTGRQKLADRYFFVRDAQCENIRLKYEETLKNTDVLREIEEIAKFSTNPILIDMMYLARKASAMIMADPDSHENAYKDYLEIAEQHTELVPACRETGLVFYIKYNFICLRYEKCLDKKLKQELFNIAGKAVDHFTREYEQVANDFQNIFKIKLAHLQLGIGVLGSIIEDAIITEEEINDATMSLSKLNEKQLSNRWKWGYYIAKSKILWLRRNLHDALKYAEIAYSHAVKGKFKKEVKGTEDMLNAIRSELCGSSYLTTTKQNTDQQELNSQNLPQPDSTGLCDVLQGPSIREPEPLSKLPQQQSQPLNNFQLILDAINQMDRKLSKLDMLDDLGARMSVLETRIDNINKPDMLNYLSAKMSALETQVNKMNKPDMLNSLSDRMTAIKSQVDNITREMTSFKQEFNEQFERFTSVERRLASLETEIEKLVVENKELKQTL
ncbi:uncharacterized protein LOC127711660 [Mytilus californianus]|uniref:uncharacterized protein LOC127711660 n=1 Tax=Mytilus californianus TaxID=6549 RepID=UPI0022474182|nr:uncharacterized protein LOC127711660 [Mytilus californianus]